MLSDLSPGNASKPPKDGSAKLRRQNFTMPRLTLDSESERNVVTYEHPSSTTPAIRTAPPSNLLRLTARPAATSPTLIDISRTGATKAQWRARAERAQRQNI
jgi:hypothetical protein